MRGLSVMCLTACLAVALAMPAAPGDPNPFIPTKEMISAFIPTPEEIAALSALHTTPAPGAPTPDPSIPTPPPTMPPAVVHLVQKYKMAVAPFLPPAPAI